MMWDSTESANKNYNIVLRTAFYLQLKSVFTLKMAYLTFRRRIKSQLPFAGIFRRLPYSTRFQDKG